MQWVLLGRIVDRLGFAFLSGAGGATLHSADEKLSNQIDVVAIDSLGRSARFERGQQKDEALEGVLGWLHLSPSYTEGRR